MAPFREFRDDELAGLSDEELMDYIRRARAAGRMDAASTAARILAFSYEDMVRSFVRNRVSDMGDQVIEDIVEVAVFDAVRSAESFKGETVPQFRAFVYTIAGRRIDDYHRKGRVRHGDKDIKVKTTPLEYESDEEIRHHDEPVIDPSDALLEGILFSQALFELERDDHRMVIELRRFRGLSYREIADEVNRHFGGRVDDSMTENNANKIDSRFEERFQRLLVEAEDPPPLDDDD
jgi:RNA polymerase sigma factor (sigma-70 family)